MALASTASAAAWLFGIKPRVFFPRRECALGDMMDGRGRPWKREEEMTTRNGKQNARPPGEGGLARGFFFSRKEKLAAPGHQAQPKCCEKTGHRRTMVPARRLRPLCLLVRRIGRRGFAWVSRLLLLPQMCGGGARARQLARVPRLEGHRLAADFCGTAVRRPLGRGGFPRRPAGSLIAGILARYFVQEAIAPPRPCARLKTGIIKVLGALDAQNTWVNEIGCGAPW